VCTKLSKMTQITYLVL